MGTASIPWRPALSRVALGMMEESASLGPVMFEGVIFDDVGRSFRCAIPFSTVSRLRREGAPEGTPYIGGAQSRYGLNIYDRMKMILGFENRTILIMEGSDFIPPSPGIHLFCVKGQPSE